MKWTTTLAVLLLCSTATSYEILLAAPVSTNYVNNVFCAIARELINNGNKVTLISMHPPNFWDEKLTFHKIVPEKSLLQDLNQFQVNSSTLNKYVTGILENTAEAMWEGFKIKNVLEEKDKFDAVVIPAFLNEIAYPFLEDFSGVFVTVYSQGAEHFIVSRATNVISPINPSLDDPYFGDYSLKDKFLYSVSALNHVHVENSGIFPGMQEILKMSGRKIDDLTRYRSLSRLNLVDGHSALNGLTPLMPKQVEIGTIAVKKPAQLPQFVEEFLRSDSGNGVIYVSFGSNTRSAHIPKSFKVALLSALSRLPYKVLWQYDGMDLDKHSNVLLRKVMPQQDILGHSTTRVFISHCSLPAVQEAAYHGVPVLAVPVALDQHKNADRLVARGLAVSMDWKTATADSIVAAVTTLTEDQSYADNMAGISGVLQDQKESPGERAAWWIDYTIRQQGAPLLQYQGAHHAVRSYCDQDLLKLWGALGAALGFLGGATLVILLRALYDCIFATPKTKRKTQ